MRIRILGLLAVVALLAGACSSGGDSQATTTAADEGGTMLRVVIPDGNIRPEGAECSGARPYRHIRPGVAYEVVSGDGAVLVEGELPPGAAENADPSIDWEELTRIPTVCIMELGVGVLPTHDRYELRIDGAKPLAFAAGDVAVGTPVVLILEG